MAPFSIRGFVTGAGKPHPQVGQDPHRDASLSEIYRFSSCCIGKPLLLSGFFFSGVPSDPGGRDRSSSLGWKQKPPYTVPETPRELENRSRTCPITRL